MNESSMEISDQVFSQLLMDVVQELSNCSKGNFPNGVPSGFKKLDRYIGGFKEGTFSIIASFPSVGKTSMALSLAINMAFGANNVPVGFFSLDLTGKSLIQRVISNRTHFELKRLMVGDITTEEYEELIRKTGKLYAHSEDFLLQDTQEEIGLLCGAIKKMVEGSGVKAVFIDSIDFIYCKSPYQSRRETLIEVSRILRMLAREVRIPIICTCSVVSGKERVPGLENLRDLGLLDQYVDLAILIDDPMMRIASNEGWEMIAEEKRNIRKIIIAKNRDGRIGAFNMRFDNSCCCYMEEDSF